MSAGSGFRIYLHCTRPTCHFFQLILGYLSRYLGYLDFLLGIGLPCIYLELELGYNNTFLRGWPSTNLFMLVKWRELDILM